MTPDQVARLIANGESERVEFKESATADLRSAVCALANDLGNTGEPGYLFVGISDNGGISGLRVDDELLQRLAQIRTSGDLQPLPSISVEKYELGEGAFAVVTVAPSDDPPLRYRGRVLVRIGTTTQTASAQDERRLVERRRGADVPFDHRSARDSSIEDLDLEFFRQTYLPEAYATDVLDANGRSVEERLVALRFAKPPTSTYGGILVLGIDPMRFVPGAYIQFVIYDGRSITDDALDQKVFSGRIDAVTGAILDSINLAIPRSLSRSDSAKDVKVSPYPVAAVRELIVNAIMHRDYQSGNAPIRVSFFDDRIEIWNPGGPFDPVRRDVFGRGGVTAYRNPVLADALKTLGFAQKFGFGIPFARQALAENGNPAPVFQVEPNFINVVLGASA